MTAPGLDRDGAEFHPALAEEILPVLEVEISDVGRDVAGVRLTNRPALSDLLSPRYPIGREAARLLGAHGTAVRAILFDKHDTVNWQLDWHQDRTVALREKREVEGFSNWNVKQGIVHAEPPFALLRDMVTVRIHLDRVGESNGVLEVVAGSHRYGRIAESRIAEIVEGGTVMQCPAEAGDCWFYRTPILHRSARSRTTLRRRVLQVDYSAATLPGGLEWRGV